MAWTIYIITNNKNKKVYIGQTRQKLNHRHKKDGKGYTERNPESHFARAIKKIGWDNFHVEPLEENIPSQELANERETYFIRKFDSVKNGYNSNYGGDAIGEISEETRQKLSKASKGTNNPFFGKAHTEQTKMLLREANSKEVYCFETNTVFNSLVDAGQKTGLDYTAISLACHRKTEKCGGYHWCFLKDKEKYIPRKNIHKRPVYCLETGVTYGSIIEASKQTGILRSSVDKAVRGITNSCGGLHFCYLDEKDSRVFKPDTNLGKKQKIVCVETGIIYESISAASRSVQRNSSSMVVALKNNGRCGGYHWKYLEE